MNGRYDARIVLKNAMEVADDAKLHYGVSAADIQNMLKLVVQRHADEGRNVGYLWSRLHRNHSTEGKGWCGKHCGETFQAAGKYVVLGKTKRESDMHKKVMKRMRKEEDEEEKLKIYARYAKGETRADHAIAIDVNEGGQGRIMENGCSVKDFDILNLASRMDDVKTCYKLDLYYVM
jgi:hypothetical protein